MKITLISFTVIVFLIAGCGKNDKTNVQNDKQKTEQKNKIDTTKLVADGKYVCPMHPLEQANEPMKCPICRMNMVSKEEHNKEQADNYKKLDEKYSGNKNASSLDVKLSLVKSEECELAISDVLAKAQ